MDLLEIVVPAHQRPIVVAPQALHVEHAEVRVVGVRDELAQRRQRAAREDVLADPRLRHHLIVARDCVQQENAAVLQQMICRLHVRRVVRAAHVLHHADTDDAVKEQPLILEVAVVDELNLHLALEPFRLDALLSFFPLLLTERAAVALDAVLLRRLNQQEAPAAADVEERHAFLEVELLEDVVDLVALRLLECVILVLEVRARIAHRRIEPELIEFIA